MDSLILIITICIAIPLAFSLILLDSHARLFVGFIIVGAAVCVIASFVNTYVVSNSGLSSLYMSTNIIPLVEEVLKATPVLIFAYLVSDKWKTLMSIAIATGIGFAIVENIFIFIQNDASLSVVWAVCRVFGASLMHSICTATVGYGISFVRKKKKLFLTGTFALLIFAAVYHSIFNLLIQSQYAGFGILVPIITYIPVVIWYRKQYKK